MSHVRSAEQKVARMTHGNQSLSDHIESLAQELPFSDLSFLPLINSLTLSVGSIFVITPF